MKVSRKFKSTLSPKGNRYVKVWHWTIVIDGMVYHPYEDWEVKFSDGKRSYKKVIKQNGLYIGDSITEAKDLIVLLHEENLNTNKNLRDLLKNLKTERIVIMSGDGPEESDNGDTVLYTGTRNIHAIEQRLKNERAGGDRWARALVFCHVSDSGPVGINVESVEHAHFPDCIIE